MSGSIIRWKVEAPFFGLMVVNMKVTSKTILKKEKEFSGGLMAGSIMDNGLKTSKMEKEHTHLKEGREKAFGIWEKYINGLNLKHRSKDHEKVITI